MIKHHENRKSDRFFRQVTLGKCFDVLRQYWLESCRENQRGLSMENYNCNVLKIKAFEGLKGYVFVDRKKKLA